MTEFPHHTGGLQVSYRLLGLGLGDDGKGWTADRHPGRQVLGGVDEEAGLGVEEELCGVDVDHCSQLKGDVALLERLKTLTATW